MERQDESRVRMSEKEKRHSTGECFFLYLIVNKRRELKRITTKGEWTCEDTGGRGGRKKRRKKRRKKWELGARGGSKKREEMGRGDK